MAISIQQTPRQQTNFANLQDHHASISGIDARINGLFAKGDMQNRDFNTISFQDRSVEFRGGQQKILSGLIENLRQRQQLIETEIGEIQRSARVLKGEGAYSFMDAQGDENHIAKLQNQLTRIHRIGQDKIRPLINALPKGNFEPETNWTKVVQLSVGIALSAIAAIGLAYAKGAF